MAFAKKLPYEFIIIGMLLIIIYCLYYKANTETFSSVPTANANAASVLNMAKFCKDYAASNNTRPFDNQKFKDNCGMCLTSGTLIDKTKFDVSKGSPVGVLVYQADKNKFLKEKTRPVPSSNAATCVVEGSNPSLVINQADYDKFRKKPTVNNDPCLNPAGQVIDNYADACLRDTLTAAGCSKEGTWYKYLNTLRADYKGKSTANMKAQIGITSRRDKSFMMKCFGQDLSTPCDPYLPSSGIVGSVAVPNQECMTYLYTNQSAASDFVGPAYSGEPLNATGTQLPFCQSAGSLNPASAAGLAQLQSAAQQYNGSRGVIAVKSYLTDVFAKATSDKPQNVPDDKGGRYDSWGKCIGTPVELAGVPGALNVTATPGNATADISWTTPDTGGAEITGYSVNYNPLEPTGNVTNTGVTTAKITGLRNGITYTISVVANNIMGSSTGTATVTPVQPVCATAGQDIDFATSQCSSTGMWQKYLWGSSPDGECIQQTSGAPTCNSNCPGALVQGGCGYVPCPTAGQTGFDYSSRGMKQNYTWASGANGACVKNNNGPAVCDSNYPASLAQGGCVYCLTGGSIKPGCPGYLMKAVQAGTRTWNSVASSSDGVKIVAVAWKHNIYTSADSGTTWTARDEKRMWISVASSSDGVKLVALDEGAYGSGGGKIYTSTDSGATWTPRDEKRMWRAVASSSDGVKLVAGIYGGNIYTSTDSGVSWTPRDSNRYWSSIASSEDGVKIVAATFGRLIYTSTDSGISWTPRESERAWNSVASSSDGVKLVAVAWGDKIYTSTDSGESWTPREQNRVWWSVSSSRDGTKLAAVEKDGKIYTSTDSGESWTPRDENRRWQSVALSSNGEKLVAVDTGPWGGNGGEIYIYNN